MGHGVTGAERGFPVEEFRHRVARAQREMQHAELAALLLTTEPEVRYFTGFLTRFWESPTRPWFVVLPASGLPVAVIPSIGVHLMSQTWLTDIRHWPAPDDDDNGVGLLAETLSEVVPGDGRIGLADARGSHVRMPLADLETLRQRLAPRRFVGDARITDRLRAHKSPSEIAKIAEAARIAGRAFDRVSDYAKPGQPLDAVFRRFQMTCLEEGADWVPYLAGASGKGGYRDVISPATSERLGKGDVLMLDTGVMWDGYFCDFDRNFSLGAPTDAVAEAHGLLIDATSAAFSAARIGNTFADLFAAMAQVLGDRRAPGRLGHGVGMQLTEGGSILARSEDVIEPGMVIALEPCISMAEGKIMVHEENIVVQENGAQWLSSPAPREIRQI